MCKKTSTVVALIALQSIALNWKGALAKNGKDTANFIQMFVDKLENSTKYPIYQTSAKLNKLKAEAVILYNSFSEYKTKKRNFNKMSKQQQVLFVLADMLAEETKTEKEKAYVQSCMNEIRYTVQKRLLAVTTVEKQARELVIAYFNESEVIQLVNTMKEKHSTYVINKVMKSLLDEVKQEKLLSVAVVDLLSSKFTVKMRSERRV